MNDGSSIASNLAALIPDAMALLNAVISILAVALFIGAVLKFVSYGKGRDGTSLATPVMFLASGVMLWNLGMSANSFLETTFGQGTSTSTLMTYTAGDSMPAQSAAFLATLIMFIRLYGYYAFAAGWWKVRKISAGTQASDGSLASAAMHIAGGVFAINIVQTVNAITSTFGFGELL